ncbi:MULTISPECIES: 3D-(3,5/4)-trihydroxycyclohexane-1,2-dione acylhydrolase (decyclizing) [Kordiimonas]|jgi:3D-(3,5/4)-trihydroxycyclohexane-1,2-dione acylhydrolase (decyclizing)|uniref:3D-(3,5/4)-trihydroxycyclohexane-1,2-dione hydrolase n=1 Tax=Kordiimonas lacus TaxID=637679 RepID=A0A1G7D449_9PROT|nr:MULTISPECIES: 3D-(3,5/4)-trihydroxycyclohexane-1,2-dione acylhydrolase (decyclizing) [Kordiimonas]SDE46444.1 3D-(3,5/4)-trihydroxycyclohexane-1,2-dione hydrolase [Kordiimonas lacus]
MKTIRLTMGQALARYLAAQFTEVDGERLPMFAGVFAIFGHGNVAGFGEALNGVQESLPTFRAHNEQAMAHTAIAFAKASRRRRMMACTTSVGPGATNMVTAAALAHVNRLPVLLLPGDTFANRRPDPVLQQVENPESPLDVANDCFRPVSRYFDRITRPEQLITSLPQAMRVLICPVDCGPVTICLPQDVQAEAYDFPESMFEAQTHRMRRQGADSFELERALGILNAAEKPLIIVGGGVRYSGAEGALADLAERCGIPVAETQAGKGSLSWTHELNVGGIGVTGTAAANAFAREADVVLAVGTRLADFTTGSRSLFENPDCQIIGLNVAAFDAVKHRSIPLVSDARLALEALAKRLPAADGQRALAATRRAEWNSVTDKVTSPDTRPLPSDAEIVGAIHHVSDARDVIVAAAGGLPGELHKLWRVKAPATYHLEYGYSCMGYEIAGGLGVKMATPASDVFVLVGDGSYMMMNSELSTSIMMGQKLIVILVDNGGFGCINRLQGGTTGTSFNNLFDSGTRTDGERPVVDFVAHARSMGAIAEKADGIDALKAAVRRAKIADRTSVIVIDADPSISTEDGGHWWDVPVAEESDMDDAAARHAAYMDMKRKQKIDG